ncbi:Hypothetical predicted protein [Octopus vulgaris]|uniref:Beta-lactamase-related domain-containing protein n=1 Tax=Octopus vulgaris TaxID=6645 RepID=A0AA36FBP3_OCTVU|nr:Hypothetical predicted protein [Octopus vulgaris]
MLTFRELFVFCCFCVIIFSDSIQCRAAEQRYSQNETHEKISVFANTLLRVKNLVAGAVVVVKNDEVVYRQGFGRRNLSSEAKVDNNTLFGIASLTKAFGAATLVKVIEEMKNVSLKTPISDYLDDIEFSTEQRTKYANIEDLLAHRMGLPRNNFLRLNQNFNRQTIPKFLKYFEEIADFRGSYVYNNIMYGLATLITEKLANNTWEDVVTEKILRPLGMNATKFSTRSSGDEKNIARSYIEQEKKRLVQVPFSFKRKWADIGASGSIQTTANDISKWMRFLLNGNTSLLCNIFKVRNFAIQTKNRFHRPEMPVEYSNSQYALGWNKGHYRDLIQCLDSEQNYSQNQIHEMIANFTNTMLEDKNMVGGAVAVVKNNQVVYLRGFGRRNLNSSDKVDNHTLFGLASLTKAFTAATLVKVMEDRKDVSQTMPISKFLDIEFSTEQRTKYANVEDLLSHRMGLPKNNYLRLNLELTRDNIPQYVKQFKQYKDFRTSFMYSSIMFGLAAHITEKLTNNTWENMISEKILRPLGMRDTKFITKPYGGKKNVATPYVEDDDVKKTLIEVPASFKRKWGRIGSGAVQSSANDMSKWMRFLLNGKRSFLCNIFGTRNFLVQTTNVFRRPKMPVAYINDKYALGWKKGFYRGYPIIVHTGTNWGNNLVLTLFPEEKLGIFVALTGSDFQAYKRTLVMQYVADLYLGNEPWINASSIKDFKVPKYKPRCPNPPSNETNRFYLFGSRPSYEGTYSNSLWGNITVTKTKSGTLRFTYGFVTFQLIPSSKAFSSFTAKGTGEMRFLKLSSVYFEVCSKRGVVAITVPSFEKLMPPTFWKIT